MNILIRFSLLTLIALCALALAPRSWARYNTWLMAGLLAAAGVLFIL